MLSDFRFALRSLTKTPGFALIVVLSLALGIGANATVLCWMRNILWRPIQGVENPEQLVVITTLRGDAQLDTVSIPNSKDLNALKEVFDGVISSQITPICATIEGKAEWAYAQVTTANYFSMLGVQPLLGRFFLPSEDQAPGRDAVIVISETYWKRRFGASPAVIGSTLEINQRNFTIVGVAPSAFRGTMSGLSFDVWAPISMHKEVSNSGNIERRDDHWTHTQGRLRKGLSLEKAQAALDTLAAQLSAAYPDSNKSVRFRVLPLWRSPYGGQSILLPVLGTLLVVCLGVFLVVCVNVANLLLVRTLRRHKEIAVRLSLGANGWQVARHLLAESLCLSLVGGALGVLFAFWSVDLLGNFFPKTHLPLGYTLKMDAPVLGLVLLLTLGAGLLLSLLPIWQASRLHIQDALKDSSRGSTGGPKHHRIRTLLVASETALALTLLVGAGLCAKGFQKARETDMGLDPKGLLIAGFRVGMNGYDEARGIQFYAKLQEKLSSMPGVKNAALASWYPMGFEGCASGTLKVNGYLPAPGEYTGVLTSIISPGYFQTIKTPLLEGRDFTDADDFRAQPVVIINEALAQKYWPGQRALGQSLRIHGRDRRVVGIVKTGKYRSLSEQATPFLFFPYRQGAWDLNLGVVLSGESQDPLALVPALREAVRSIDPHVEIWALLRMTDYVSAAFVAQGMATAILGSLGLVSLVLASLGVYGVMAFIVSQRTQEFGIRIALGADRSNVLGLVLKQGLRMSLLGIAAGLLLSALLSRFLANFLLGVSPFDLGIFIAIPLLLVLVSLVSCYLPAWRATRINPLTALRED